MRPPPAFHQHDIEHDRHLPGKLLSRKHAVDQFLPLIRSAVRQEFLDFQMRGDAPRQIEKETPRERRIVGPFRHWSNLPGGNQLIDLPMQWHLFRQCGGPSPEQEQNTGDQ
ncbi:MAG: hypothetical protein R3C12_03040 [Planctomycetaceae bacterium]